MELIGLSQFEGHTATLAEQDSNGRLLAAAPALLAEDKALRAENERLRLLTKLDENQQGGLVIKLMFQNATLRAENKRLRGLIIEFADKMTESIKALQGEELPCKPNS